MCTMLLGSGRLSQARGRLLQARLGSSEVVSARVGSSQLVVRLGHSPPGLSRFVWARPSSSRLVYGRPNSPELCWAAVDLREKLRLDGQRCPDGLGQARLGSCLGSLGIRS